MSTCRAPGCESVVGSKGAKGACPKHYKRLQAHGSFDLPSRPTACSVDGCEKARKAHGLCVMHLTRLQKRGTLEPPRKPSRLELILSRAQPAESGCWEWDGATVKGYGHSHYERKHYYAHVAMWEEFNGPVPDGLLVRHRCDNPLCCNPDHLLIGTALDNTRDMIERGRAFWQREPRALPIGSPSFALALVEARQSA